MHFDSYYPNDTMGGLRKTLRKAERKVRRTASRAAKDVGLKKVEQTARKAIPKEIRKPLKKLAPLLPFTNPLQVPGGILSSGWINVKTMDKGRPGSKRRRKYHRRLGLMQKATTASAAAAVGAAVAPAVSASAAGSSALPGAIDKAQKAFTKLQSMTANNGNTSAPVTEQTKPNWLPIALLGAAALLLGG